jgi:hypothetical protein
MAMGNCMGNGNGNATAMAPQSRRPLHGLPLPDSGNDNAICSDCLWPILALEEHYEL